MLMRAILVGGLTLLGVEVALVPGARAALCVRLGIRPSSPRVGQTAAVELRSLAPFGSSNHLRLKPLKVPPNTFRVRLISPGGGATPVHIERSSDPTRWVGRVAFPEPGTFQVRVLNFEAPGTISGVNPRCYTRLQVLVRTTESGTDLFAPIAATVVVLIALAVRVVARLRTTRSS
jgi:hypothetical protein